LSDDASSRPAPIDAVAGPGSAPGASEHAPGDARRRFLTGLLLAATGAVLFSGKAIIVKLAYRYGVDAVTILALRMAMALPFFAFVAWYVNARRPVTWQPGDRWRVAAIGLSGYYLASFLDFLGLQYVSVGLERVILYLTPTIVLLLSVGLLGRRIGARDWTAMALAYTGVVFVFWHDLSLEGSNVALGSLFVFGSASAYAVYLVASGELVQRLGALRLTAHASMVASFACIVQALVIDPAALWTQPAPVYSLSLLNAIACTVAPVFLVMIAIERIGSPAASQTGMIGPVATIAMGAAFLGEPVSAPQLIGTAIVVAGMLILGSRKFN